MEIIYFHFGNLSSLVLVLFFRMCIFPSQGCIHFCTHSSWYIEHFRAIAINKVGTSFNRLDNFIHYYIHSQKARTKHLPELFFLPKVFKTWWDDSLLSKGVIEITYSWSISNNSYLRPTLLWTRRSDKQIVQNIYA